MQKKAGLTEPPWPNLWTFWPNPFPTPTTNSMLLSPGLNCETQKSKDKSGGRGLDCTAHLWYECLTRWKYDRDMAQKWAGESPSWIYGLCGLGPLRYLTPVAWTWRNFKYLSLNPNVLLKGSFTYTFCMVRGSFKKTSPQNRSVQGRRVTPHQLE